jgi:APA family basic amino acid/polyamine antiporter
VAILILRKTDPNRPRPFKVPFSPYIPLAGIICSGGLMIYSMYTSKNPDAHILFFVWVIMGLLFYLTYSYKQLRKTDNQSIEENNG